jgi:hypothetical protein
MNRDEIINYLIKKNNFQTYLEIGVRNPDDCFNKIICPIKHSVDPGYEFEIGVVDYKYTSDEFFSLLDNGKLNLNSKYKWDIIFIDGWHISSQVEKDFLNSLNHLFDNGFIVIHDCNPPDLWHAREDFNNMVWNGTVWKLIYKLRATRPDLAIYTVDTDWGVGIVKKGEQKCCDFNNSFYEYNEFNKNKKEHLNLITIKEFNTIF